MPKDTSDDIMHWTKNTTTGDGTTICGANKIMGGYGVSGQGHYFSRRFTWNTESSNNIRVQIVIDIYFIDSWDRENLNIRINGVLYRSIKHYVYSI